MGFSTWRFIVLLIAAFILGILVTLSIRTVALQTIGFGPWTITEQTDTRIVLERDVVEEPTATPTTEPDPTATDVPPTATEDIDLTGETCPAWVHDQYVTTGPDGGTYATWHPQIDPEHGCYFRHEHGTDPSLLGNGWWQPAFDYAPNKAGMSEPHEGFKIIVWTDEGSGYHWGYLIHQGTAGQGRACVRFHTAGMGVAYISTGQRAADVQILGDYGEAVINVTKTKIPLSSCDHIAPLGGYETEIVDGVEVINYSGTHGERQIGSYGQNAIAYEPWRIDTRPTEAVLGWHDGDLGVNAHSAMTLCETDECAAVVPSGGFVDGEYVYDWTHRHGASRFLTHRADDKETLGIEDMTGLGEFCTNVFGTELVDCGEPGALVQYVAPGLSAFTTDGGKKYVVDSQTFYYADADQLPFGRGQLNHDMALGSPN